MTEEQTDAAAWTVDGETRVGGPKAVALMIAVAWDSKLPLLPFRLVPVSYLLDRIYELVASNRHRLPGQTPWCVAHPDACHPPPD